MEILTDVVYFVKDLLCEKWKDGCDDEMVCVVLGTFWGGAEWI